MRSVQGTLFADDRLGSSVLMLLGETLPSVLLDSQSGS